MAERRLVPKPQGCDRIFAWCLWPIFVFAACALHLARIAQAPQARKLNHQPVAGQIGVGLPVWVKPSGRPNFTGQQVSIP